MQQMMAAQPQLMQMVAQFLVNQNAPPSQPPSPPPPPPQVDRLERFLKLRPNRFSTATEPIMADDWLGRVLIVSQGMSFYNSLEHYLEPLCQHLQTFLLDDSKSQENFPC